MKVKFFEQQIMVNMQGTIVTSPHLLYLIKNRLTSGSYFHCIIMANRVAYEKNNAPWPYTAS
jgi:hypothetical protein